MLHHVSVTAEDPLHVAEVLAGLIGGRVIPFAPWTGGYIAIANDGAGTAVEVYPRGTELLPDPVGQARFRHNHFAARHTGTHAAISVPLTEQEVFAVAELCDWQLQRLDRGGFEVLELWLENRVMVEILTPVQLSRYLAVVGAPRISAAGDDVAELSFSVRVPAGSAEVWRAWTRAEELVAWWGLTGARVDLRLGGAYELLFLPEAESGPRGTESCRILSYIPQQMLSFSFSAPAHLGMGREHTWVVVTLTPAGRGTDLRLQHCGFGTEPQWTECREYFRRAWHRVMHRFATHWDAQSVSLPQQPGTIDLRDSSAAGYQAAVRRPSAR